MGIYIQFLGLVGSGKTYLAQDLMTKTGGCRIAFAQEVYRLAEIVIGRPINKSLKADRELLKLIGTTWGREAQAITGEIHDKLEPHKPAEWGSPDIWANIFIANCLRHSSEVSIFNDDTRFENELKIATEKMRFIPVFVKCDEATRLQRLKNRGEDYDSNDATHQSEQMINLLNKMVLSDYYMPVVWNDQLENMPRYKWVYHISAFEKLVLSHCTNVSLARELGWSSDRARKLIALVAEK